MVPQPARVIATKEGRMPIEKSTEGVEGEPNLVETPPATRVTPEVNPLDSSLPMFSGFTDTTQHGLFKLDMGFPPSLGIHPQSQIVASMTELNSRGLPFLGHATMQVLNIAPQENGTVQLLGHVDWTRPLPVRVNFVVFNF
jgi:hypothetical protein